jgi:hypothetical protein
MGGSSLAFAAGDVLIAHGFSISVIFLAVNPSMESYGRPAMSVSKSPEDTKKQV